MTTNQLDQNPPAHLLIIGQNLTGRAVVLRKNCLPARLRAFRHRVWVAHCGFGCDPDLSGSAVFGEKVFDGRRERLNRGDVLRFATVEEIQNVTCEGDGH